jgi:para-nitrobenzyl esterase
MKKICSLFLFSTATLSLTAQVANCNNSRFHDYVFPTVPTPLSNVQYGANLKSTGANQNLLMDIYQPVGDVATMRPLVIIAHGGSFVSGSKTGTDVVPLCKDLARMGYVTASIEYRLGMTHFPLGGPPDSTDAGPAVMRGTHDARAAVRYFRKNARIGGNTYKIDTNNIYFAGVSAGGFMALHLAYLDQTSELLPYIDTITQYGMAGGVEGNSGNPGYSSKVNAIINICGALADTSMIHTGDTPLLSFHGTNDGTVPYDYDIIKLLGTYPILKVHGSSTVAMRANNQGLENCFVTWQGADHVPEVGSAIYYDSTITIMRNFLERFMCNIPLECSKTQSPTISTGIVNEGIAENQIDIFPNPAHNLFTIDLSKLSSQQNRVEMYSSIGQRVLNNEKVISSRLDVDVAALTPGLYTIRIYTTDGKVMSRKLIIK